jgi:hypothetical protein
MENYTQYVGVYVQMLPFLFRLSSWTSRYITPDTNQYGKVNHKTLINLHGAQFFFFKFLISIMYTNISNKTFRHQ